MMVHWSFVTIVRDKNTYLVGAFSMQKRVITNASIVGMGQPPHLNKYAFYNYVTRFLALFHVHVSVAILSTAQAVRPLERCQVCV